LRLVVRSESADSALAGAGGRRTARRRRSVPHRQPMKRCLVSTLFRPLEFDELVADRLIDRVAKSFSEFFIRVAWRLNEESRTGRAASEHPDVGSPDSRVQSVGLPAEGSSSAEHPITGVGDSRDTPGDNFVLRMDHVHKLLGPNKTRFSVGMIVVYAGPNKRRPICGRTQ
jgi:hypothetical protein